MKTTLDQQALLEQLPNLDFSRFKNSFKSGFNTSINAMAAQAIQNASQYFPKEGVQALGELAALVAGMFDKAVDARGGVLLDMFIFVFLTDDLLEKSARSRKTEKLHNLKELILMLVRNETFDEAEYPEWRAIIKYSRPIFSQFQAMASRALFHRFSYQYQEYLDGVAWEASIQPPNQVPDLDICRHVKRYVSGAHVGFVLAEFAHGIELPITVRSHPEIQKFCALASDLAVYDNVFLMVVKDIFSLKKEIRDGTVSNTIIFMCLHGTVESLQVAVDRVIQLREEAERDLISVVNDLPQFGVDNAVAQEYVTSITRCIGGNFKWCSKATRYHGLLLVN